jgi:hypothetical protein
VFTLPLTDSGDVTEPGIYDIPEDVYHADPVPGGSLSVSGAKKLLPPHCPARFRHDQLFPPPPTRAMELGTAAHKTVLGIGAEIVAVDAENWTTKAAKDQRDAIRGGGGIPLLRREHTQVQDMADAIRRHRIAGSLLSPDRGDPERSVFWQDEETGIWRRARLDLMPRPGPRRMIITDYKTCVSASPEEIPKTVANLRYDMQDDWYRAAVRAVYPGEDDPEMVFIFQEKTPPYLITCAYLADDARMAGERLNRAAIERYRDCAAVDIWPGYTTEVEPVTLPPWARRGYTEELS